MRKSYKKRRTFIKRNTKRSMNKKTKKTRKQRKQRRQHKRGGAPGLSQSIAERFDKEVFDPSTLQKNDTKKYSKYLGMIRKPYWKNIFSNDKITITNADAISWIDNEINAADKMGGWDQEERARLVDALRERFNWSWREWYESSEKEQLDAINNQEAFERTNPPARLQPESDAYYNLGRIPPNRNPWTGLGG